MKRQPRILLVEDDTALADLYRASLRLAGYDVNTAHDGFAALEVLEAERPDAIVLDLELPRVQGETVLEEIAAMDEDARMPVIVVTGSHLNETATQAAAILRKPCAPELLLATLEHSLRAA